jgi:hypothetical protein
MRTLILILVFVGLCWVFPRSKPCPIDNQPSFTDGAPIATGDCVYKHYDENGRLVHTFTSSCP